jgi:hypothetical protein
VYGMGGSSEQGVIFGVCLGKVPDGVERAV